MNGETPGKATGDLDGLLDRAAVGGHLVGHGQGQRSFQDQDQAGVVGLQQPRRSAAGEGALCVSFTEVARVRKDAFNTAVRPGAAPALRAQPGRASVRRR